MKIDNPLLTYSDVSMQRSQTITLFQDQIVVKGTVFIRGNYESAFPLKVVSANYQKLRIRDNTFFLSILLFIISTGIAGIFHAIPGTSIDSFIGGLITYLPAVWVIAGIASLKKSDVAQFCSLQGQPLFAIFRCGKEKVRFDEVITQLVTQIEKNSKS